MSNRRNGIPQGISIAHSRAFSAVARPTINWMDLFSEFEEKKALEKDELGKNLLSLMKEANNPLMDRALEYIAELEEEVKEANERAKEAKGEVTILLAEVQRLTEEYEKLKQKKTIKPPDWKELQELKNKMYHPAFKKR